tara:strand:- start:495 stop:2195 length:1701 start_codon:yes stop_codon:yes gene_type:complete
MKQIILCLSLVSVFLLSSAYSGDIADEVFLDGTIYTFNESLDIKNSLAIKDGLIIAVGKKSSIQKLIGDQTKISRLNGKMMLPSFHDAHSHPVYSGIDELKCTVLYLDNLEEVLTTIKTCLNNEITLKTGWLVGTGLDLSLFPQANPNKSLLDEISSDIPIYMVGSDGHSAWANSKALEIANISSRTPNPLLGIIERDPSSGEPSGTLREPSAMNLIKDIMPYDTDDMYDQAFLYAQDLAHSFGITSIIVASVGKRELGAYKRAANKGILNLKLVTSIEYGSTSFYSLDPKDFESVLSSREKFRDPRINVDSVKIYIDGVLEGQTAAVLEPYIDSGRSGQLYFSQDVLNSEISRFDAMGLQIHTHAIGDRAVRSVLDAFEYAQKLNGQTDNRHHISHLQLISEEDISRFSELNVAANFQSAWALPDNWIMGINLPELGQERVDRMYPVASVFQLGGLIVGGSDWGVSTMNPLVAIETALTRQDPDGIFKGTLNENEAMTLTEMLKAYTVNTAYLMHQEDKTGSLEIGKAADLVILERDLYKIPIHEISEVRVLQTIIEGETVFAID